MKNLIDIYKIDEFIENISDGFIALNNEFKIVLFNKVAEKYFGKKSDEVLGMHIFKEVFPGMKNSNFEKELNLALKDGKPRQLETYFDITPYSNSYKVKLQPNKKGISVFLQVITQITKESEKFKFQEKLLDSMGQAIIVTKPNGMIIQINKKATELFGWESEEIVGKSIIDITPTEENKEEANDIMDKIKAGESWEGEFFVKNKNGREFPIYVANTPILDEQGNLEAIIGVSTDISLRYKVEQEMRETRNELEWILKSMLNAFVIFDSVFDSLY